MNDMFRKGILLIVFVDVLGFGLLAPPLSAAKAGQSQPAGTGTEAVPSATPTPQTLPSTSDSPVVSQVFEVVFASDTLFDAIAAVLEEASSREMDALSNQTEQMSSFFREILRPPDAGHYAAVASSGLKTAAALAPALFLVRLALFHWNRLTSGDDELVRVFGDWMASGFTAVVAGPFLDQLVQVGWWIAVAALGETTVLAQDFLKLTAVSNFVSSLPAGLRSSLFSTVFAVGGGLGGLLGAVGLAFAFAVSQAVLYLLGVVAPVIAVISVVPHMRWLRGIWLKAATVLALLPVAAGGIFKGAVAFALAFPGSGMGTIFIRLCWLWGAAGFMLSLAGILGKFSLTAAVESAGKLASGVQSIVTTAMVASGSLGGTASVGTLAANLRPIGPPNPPGHTNSSLSGSSLAGNHTTPDAGSAARVLQGRQFDDGFSALTPHLVAHGLDPSWLRDAYPEEMARLVDAYARHPDQVDRSPDPLNEVARLADVVRLGNWTLPPEDVS